MTSSLPLLGRLARHPGFSDFARGLCEGGFREHHRLLTREFPQPGPLVLDIGCGSGLLAHRFSPERYLGIDLQQPFLKRARGRNRAHPFCAMDARSLGLADGAFDAALLCGVIHHLDDAGARAVLGEVRRVLRPGGRLLMWEDVPARSVWNLVGRLVHRLDAGGLIRTAEHYASLLEPAFVLEWTESLRSGFMDYQVFAARPR